MVRMRSVCILAHATRGVEFPSCSAMARTRVRVPGNLLFPLGGGFSLGSCLWQSHGGCPAGMSHLRGCSADF